MKEVNYPENTISYVNQAYLTVQKNKKIYYCDHYIGQIVEACNPPENIDTYMCKDREVKIIRPCYNVNTGEFLGHY